MLKDKSVIKVGMAELSVSKSPDTLKTTGLGSCVGVCVYDAKAKVGGMAHVMLPDSKSARQATTVIGKYSDTAINELLKRLSDLGVNRKNLIAKIAGGAQMFSFAGGSEIMKIGHRNIEAVKEDLLKHSIRLVAEDVGGNYGRTIEFDLDTGDLSIRSVDNGTKIL
ncbi:chemotaxis protein CheD [Alkalicella caledoniensis]|uniref:Probable chemoreceptor glutamine deamidase CheD n=1 Tax=Alkalicella caledoniensis TaxID=2731377 RepID=A0A7G9WCM9_ALKCA|nr:chemotaxis protein CheD [Alkalicella caledoniensis]QNO16441.1 chemotaxis protein CheD [Alkalicella caledoniensis]